MKHLTLLALSTALLISNTYGSNNPDQIDQELAKSLQNSYKFPPSQPKDFLADELQKEGVSSLIEYVQKVGVTLDNYKKRNNGNVILISYQLLQNSQVWDAQNLPNALQKFKNALSEK